MIPINNSDLAWLIVADYNQENGEYHEDLRKDVIDPEINHHYQYEYYLILGEIVGGNESLRIRGIGDQYSGDFGFLIFAGCSHNGHVGYADFGIGGNVVDLVAAEVFGEFGGNVGDRPTV